MAELQPIRKSDYLHFGVPEPVSVKLSYVSESELKRWGDTGGEPQPMQQRFSSAVSFYADTTLIRDPTVDKTNLILTSMPSPPTGPPRGQYPGVLIENISRITLTRFTPFWITPNVNVRNNTVTFYSSNTPGVPYTVVVPESFYYTPATLTAALVIALNTVTGASGLTFSSTALPNNLLYSLVSAGGDYYIDNTCTAITRGMPLWNLPDEQVLSANKTTGPMKLMYTPYVDILSEAITRYARREDSTNNPLVQNKLVARIFVTGDNTSGTNPYKVPVGLVENASSVSDAFQLDWFTFDSTQNLTSIDIQLLDMWGEPLYVPPPYGGQSQSSFNYSIHFYGM